MIQYNQNKERSTKQERKYKTMLMSIEEMTKILDEKKKRQREESHHEEEWEDAWDDREWWDYGEDDGKMTVEERNR